MERNILISLITGYAVSLLPIWSWNSRTELTLGTISSSIVILIILIWMSEKKKYIKKALAFGDARTKKIIVTCVHFHYMKTKGKSQGGNYICQH